MKENTELYPKMFTWLFIGLLITFASGYALSMNELMMLQVLSIGIFPIAIIEIVIAFVLGLRLQKMNPLTTKILYIVYSVLTGITFSTIFVAFQMGSLLSIFIISAIIFGLLAFYGYTTKKDLTKLGTIIFIGLIGILIGSLLNMFIFKSAAMDTGLAIIGVLVFVGYIAYDVNKVKHLAAYVGEEKAAVYGAFQLYLDFINLFIRLLQLFGKRND
ncbi:MAG TPA: Bax inhibitor-1/YccA family protein [Candidatus Faecimonas gallistercoris]|nr:Bax inhibitor-1/YccA family protein [Candidatus Faecimonas gallistercoris]